MGSGQPYPGSGVRSLLRSPRMDLVDNVCDTLEHVLGPAAEQLRVVMDPPGDVTLEGEVEDETTHAAVLDAVAHTQGVDKVIDHLHVKPDLADEGAPKDTEFGDEGAAQAMTGSRFQRID